MIIIILILYLIYIIYFSTNRDDQSAFTFLINEYFGHGSYNRRNVFLNPYVASFWRQKSTMKEVSPFITNCTLPKKIHKTYFNSPQFPRNQQNSKRRTKYLRS